MAGECLVNQRFPSFRLSAISFSNSLILEADNGKRISYPIFGCPQLFISLSFMLDLKGEERSDSGPTFIEFLWPSNITSSI